ncbi:ATP-binding protein [Rhizobium leguminosarum]|uniref:ATP-binding protein n=1 Tax=Rhizobium leguminosarum TaxID=384 RepID=UPI003D7020F0
MAPGKGNRQPPRDGWRPYPYRGQRYRSRIPAERVARLFTPFDRLGAERISQNRTGLGLGLSKHLIDAMGGTLGFSNGEGGATFHVDLARACSGGGKTGCDGSPP